MRDRLHATACVVAVLALGVLTMLTTPGRAVAQTGPPAAGSTTGAPGSLPRTPDGRPDLQGIWRRQGVQILERDGPTPLNSAVFSAQPYPKVFTQADRLGAAHKRTRRTGMVDPSDGKLPWRPAAEAKRQEILKHVLKPPSLEYVEPVARCMPGLLMGDDRNAYHFLQRPGLVVISYEFNHQARSIPLDGRPHVGQDLRMFLGDSRGRWDGDTLVVTTTNFTDKTWISRHIPFHSRNLTLTERFTMTDAETIDYELTIDDPDLFTRPWTVAGFFTRTESDYEVMEYACAEGSRALQNVLPPPQ